MDMSAKRIGCGMGRCDYTYFFDYGFTDLRLCNGAEGREKAFCRVFFCFIGQCVCVVIGLRGGCRSDWCDMVEGLDGVFRLLARKIGSVGMWFVLIVWCVEMSLCV